MALYGNFKTFALTDLLQWVETSRKTGSLVIEHENVFRTILFREGKVVGCSSTDPPIRLGQIFLARGLITEDQLRQGLAIQEEKGGNLGTILVDMGAVSSEDVVRQVATKAEETIYGLFDWMEASFEFSDELCHPEYNIEVCLSIQDILLRGLKRYDEMRQIREVFDNPGIVLARTDQELPENLRKSRATAVILDLVDGNRTLAELLLHSRASEYLVTKFLFELYRKGFVKVVEIRSTKPQTAPVAAAVAAGSDPGRPAPGGGSGGGGTSDHPGPAAEMEFAERLLGRGEHDAAMAVLHAAARAHPGVPSIRQMITRVESSYLEAAAGDIPTDKIPALVGGIPDGEEKTLSPEEAYLVSLIDGQSDIKSILWIAPMRSVDVFRGLQKLLDRGIIGLCDTA